MESDEVIVVDTQTIVWWLQGSKRLSRLAARTIQSEDEIAIPDICCWEIGQLVIRGRVRFTAPLAGVLEELLSEPGLFLQPITPAIGFRASGLSLNRAMDPADQIVAATALEMDLPLVTSDARLQQFPGLRTIW